MEAMDAERFSEALVKEGVAHETEDAIYLQPLAFDSEVGQPQQAETEAEYNPS